MNSPVTLSLILPCYNEGSILTDNIRTIISTLNLMNHPFEVIFVDDYSRDGTQKTVQKICNTIPQCQAIFHLVNQGRGAAVMDGIRMARGLVVGFIDVDCEVSPVYIPEMVDTIIQHKADMVIGKRIYRTTISSLPRELLSVGYRWLATALLHTNGFDTESGYKFFSRKKICKIMPLLHEKGWFWDTEVTVRAIQHKFRILEVSVLFRRRFDKHSSVHILRDTWDYLIHMIHFMRQRV